MSYDATNDPDSQMSHALYELAIPMQMFENPSAIRASVWDISRGVNMHWPAYEGSWSTRQFGDLIFSQKQQTTTHEEAAGATAADPITLLTVTIVVVLWKASSGLSCTGSGLIGSIADAIQLPCRIG
jgi:hypothetical protein